jgi:hypothetical protein
MAEFWSTHTRCAVHSYDTKLESLSKIPFSKPSYRTALRSLKQADTTVPYNTALTMADTPIHLPSESKEDSQTRTPTPTSLRRINKLSNATPTSLSVTSASQEKGAIRDLGESNLPHHRAQKRMRKWTIISKDQENKMHRYACRFMANDAPSAAPTEKGYGNVTNTPPLHQAKPARLGWGTPHHHVGINLPSHPTNGAPNPAAHEPTHILPPSKGGGQTTIRIPFGHIQHGRRVLQLCRRWFLLEPQPSNLHTHFQYVRSHLQPTV